MPEHLRHLRMAVDRIDATVSDWRGPIGPLQERVASVSRRVDRIDERPERVERRLEIASV